MDEAETPTNGDIARFWNVTERTVKKWRASGAPVDDRDGMVAYFGQNPASVTIGVRRRLQDMGRMAQPQAAVGADPDWEEFQDALQGKTSDDPKAAMAAMARARDFAAFKFEKAAGANDQANQKFYADLLAKFEGTLHDAQLRAKKLGVDSGELVPREEMVRIIYSVAAQSMRSIDNVLPTLCRQLLGKTHPEQIRAVLEPALLSVRFFEPFAKSARSVNGQALPKWATDAMVDAVDDYIEDGAKMMTTP